MRRNATRLAAAWVVASAVLCAVPAAAETYYVDLAGSDADDGLAASPQGAGHGPFATLHRAVAVVAAGDTIILNDGEYAVAADDGVVLSTLGAPDGWITIQAASKHGARLVMPTTGQDVVLLLGVWDSGAQDWTRDNPFYAVIDGLEIVGGRDHAIAATGASHVVVKNCKLHDTGRDAIKVNHSSHHVVIEDNEIFSTGARDSSNCEGIDVTGSDHVTIRGNHIHDIPTFGLYLKKLSHFGLVEANLIHDAGAGIGLGESTVCYDSVARNNILYNIDTACLQGQGAVRCQFLNNTCYNVATSGWSGMRAAGAELSLEGESQFSEDLVFLNNIVMVNSPDRPMFQATSSAFANGSADMTMDHNLFFNLDASGQVSFMFQGQVQPDLASWQAWSSQDAHSMVAAPMLSSTEPSEPSFAFLTAQSPAVDSGAEVGGEVPTDHDGVVRPQLSGWDIGAREYCDGDCPTAGHGGMAGSGGGATGGGGAGATSSGGGSVDVGAAQGGEEGGCGCRLGALAPGRLRWALVLCLGALAFGRARRRVSGGGRRATPRPRPWAGGSCCP